MMSLLIYRSVSGVLCYKVKMLVCSCLYFFLVSEDTRSNDITVQDKEERGFYTETFHSSAWIYQGDDVEPGAVPPSLNSRTRVVSSKPEIGILQDN